MFVLNDIIFVIGFLYMSPFIHKFLTATQYIAPLMANFDTKSGGKGSTVLYTNVGKYSHALLDLLLWFLFQS